MTQTEFISDTYQAARKDMVILAKKHGLMSSLYQMNKIFYDMGYDNPTRLVVWLNQGKSEESYVEWLIEQPARGLWKRWRK